MTKVKFRFQLDIETAAREAIDGIDFNGLGADGTSEYEVVDVGIDDEGTGVYTCTVDLERQAGKFASADELEETLTSNFNEVTVTIDYV